MQRQFRVWLQEKTETVLTEQVTTVTEGAPGEYILETKKEEAVVPSEQKMEVLPLTAYGNFRIPDLHLVRNECCLPLVGLSLFLQDLNAGCIVWIACQAPPFIMLMCCTQGIAAQSRSVCQEATVKPEVVTEAVADAVEAAVEASEVTNQPAVVEAVVDGQAAAQPTEATVTETVATKPESDSAAAQTNGGPDPGQNRLFVGCVPHQFSEDDLRAYFEPVRHLSLPSSHFEMIAVWLVLISF